MEAQAARHTHPLLIVAAIAITLFSLVGIGAFSAGFEFGRDPGRASTPAAQAPERPPRSPPSQKPAVKPRPVVRSEPPRRSRSFLLPGPWWPQSAASAR